MKLTRIDVYRTKGNSTLKANVNISIDDKIVIKGFKVVEGKKGLFVSNPSSKGTDGKYYDICYCLNEKTKKTLENKILDEYNKNSEKVDDNTSDEL